jgi:hypothetical protein
MNTVAHGECAGEVEAEEQEGKVDHEVGEEGERVASILGTGDGRPSGGVMNTNEG